MASELITIGSSEARRLKRKPSGMTSVQLGAWLIELSQLEAHIAAAKAEASAEFDRLKAYRSSGAISMAAWMSKHTGVTKAVAARQVETATGLAGLPETRHALSAGEIPIANAERLARAKTGDHGDKLSAAAEAKLLGSAARSGSEQFSRTVSRWERSQSVDGGATEAIRRPTDGRIQIIDPNGTVISSHYSTNQQLRHQPIREGPPVPGSSQPSARPKEAPAVELPEHKREAPPVDRSEVTQHTAAA